MDRAEEILRQIAKDMKKNYISEIHLSRNINDNVYFFISVNENQMLKDKSKLQDFFTETEINNIFSKTVTKKIFLQDSNLVTYSLENYATVEQIQIIPNQQFTTYLIILDSKRIEFPCKILFNYSFKFRYYRFLEDKLKAQGLNAKTFKGKDITKLFEDVGNYDESLVSYSFSENHRHLEVIETPLIDLRKYNHVKERVHFASLEKEAFNLLNSYSLESDGFLPFKNIVIDNKSILIDLENSKNYIDQYVKLSNSVDDYDYKAFLNQKSIFSKYEEKKEKNVLPEQNQTNLSNQNKFSEDGLFKKEAPVLKQSFVPDYFSLFLTYVIMSKDIVKPDSEIEKIDYNLFLEDSLQFPKYFFKHILKFKLEFLSNLDPSSMNETWQEINNNNISSITQNTLCRIVLKNKKYYDKIFYEYFLLGV